jgi:beta-galactosidase
VLTIGRQMFDRGLGLHANSETVYRLQPGQFEQFEALVGLDSAVADEQGRPREGGTIVFEVYLDAQRGYCSGLVNNSVAPLLVRVPLGQARSLRLVVRDAGDGITCDNADWAMARLVPRPAGSH